jgi:proteasome lid subunit RPN8/RPN11
MTTEFRLSPALRDEMVAHCARERPNEACGILAAKDDRFVAVLPMINADASPVRYRFMPEQQLALYRKLDEDGSDLGAIYHSHTRTEAYPSPTDVREAREPVPYVIISLAGEDPVVRAFMIEKGNWLDDNGEVVEVPVVIEG